MRKVIIWGTGEQYDDVMLHLKAEIIQNKIEIAALVSSFRESISYLDGKRIVLPEKIKDYEFDYLIIANKEHEKEIIKHAFELGVDGKKIISCRGMCNNLFDFDRYVKILESNISIVSDECWGGVVSNTLGIQFNSPFVNLYIYSDDDYYKLVSNIQYYLNQPLALLSESTEINSAIGCIGDVKIVFNHHRNFSEAKKDWDRRVKRFNFKNYIIKKIIKDDEDAERFSNLPIKNKIGFYYKDSNLDGVISLKNYEKSRFRIGSDFAGYIRDLAKINVGGLKEYDIFKLLLGEKGFMRVK